MFSIDARFLNPSLVELVDMESECPVDRCLIPAAFRVHYHVNNGTSIHPDAQTSSGIDSSDFFQFT